MASDMLTRAIQNETDDDRRDMLKRLREGLDEHGVDWLDRNCPDGFTLVDHGRGRRPRLLLSTRRSLPSWCRTRGRADARPPRHIQR